MPKPICRHLGMTTFLILAILIIPTGTHALEIPLGGSGGGGGGGAKIGYVDMDRIFQVYPQTKDAKEDYAKQLAKKRKQVADKEAELENLRSRISVLEATIRDMPAVNPADVDTSSPSARSSTPGLDNPEASVPQSLTSLKKDLDQKALELEDMKKRASDDLAAFEGQQSQLILGKIYQALRDLALEEQVALVVDKSSILYGAGDIDLTDKLQEKVRGY